MLCNFVYLWLRRQRHFLAYDPYALQNAHVHGWARQCTETAHVQFVEHDSKDSDDDCEDCPTWTSKPSSCKNFLKSNLSPVGVVLETVHLLLHELAQDLDRLACILGV